MGYFVGGVLAVVVSLFARLVGLDRDRAFYPTVLIVVGALYVLFAVMGGPQALLIELGVMIVFVLAAVGGFRVNLWLAVAGLAGHGVFDLFHRHVIANPGVPEWWPAFCMSYDVAAAGCLAWLLSRRYTRATA
jgi:hypothetical protein